MQAFFCGKPALAGTAPVLYQSGNYQKAHRRHACLKPLRNALYQLARTSRQQESWADDYYQRKRAEGLAAENENLRRSVIYARKRLRA